MPASPTLRRAFLSALMILTVLAATRAAGQTIYEPTELGAIAGLDSEAWAINDYGQIIGRSLDADDNAHIFLWQNGELRALFHETIWGRRVVPTADYSASGGISNTGHAIATVLTPVPDDPNLLCESGLLFRPVVMSDLATPYPGEAITVIAAHLSGVSGISPDGQYAVGWTAVDFNGPIHGFLVTPADGRWSDWDVDFCGPQNTLLRYLGVLTTTDEASGATAVNSLGQVVGWSYTDYPGTGKQGYTAVLITPEDTDADGRPDNWGELTWGVPDPVNGRMQALGSLGGHNSWARDINDLGHVVGDADTADFHTHAFVWADGVMHDLGTLGGANSSAAAINNQGYIVGWSLDALGDKRAYVLKPQDRDQDGRPEWFIDDNGDGLNDLMIDLNARLPSGFRVKLTDARDVNNAGSGSRIGQIVGWGTLGIDDSQHRMAFLLTPTVGVPGTPEDEPDDQDQTIQPLGPRQDPVLLPVQPGPGGGGTQSEQEENPAAPFSPLALCGFGTLSVLPLMLAGLCGLKRRRPAGRP